MTKAEKSNIACPRCGAALRPGVRFCGKCGERLDTGQATRTSPEGTAAAGVRAAALTETMDSPGQVGPLDRLKTIFMMIINPGEVLKSRLQQVPWPLALSVSGVAFTLFFLQTGLDLARAGKSTAQGAAVMAATGAAYGTAGVALIAALGWMLARALGSNYTVEWTVRAFALGYSPALIYAFLGVLFNLTLGWNTAVAFGVTGVLWALGPMIAILKEMLEGKLATSVFIATVCGGIMLFGWALIGAR